MQCLTLNNFLIKCQKLLKVGLLNKRVLQRDLNVPSSSVPKKYVRTSAIIVSEQTPPRNGSTDADKGRGGTSTLLSI